MTRAKLTQGEIDWMVERLNSGMSREELATYFESIT